LFANLFWPQERPVNSAGDFHPLSGQDLININLHSPILINKKHSLSKNIYELSKMSQLYRIYQLALGTEYIQTIGIDEPQGGVSLAYSLL